MKAKVNVVESIISENGIENEIIKEDDKLILSRNRLFIIIGQSYSVIHLASIRSVGIQDRGFMETDDYVLIIQKGGAKITVPFAQILTKTNSLGMIDGNVGGAMSQTKQVNPRLREWVQTINDARMKMTEVDIAEWKKYEEERLIAEEKRKKEAEAIAQKKREYEASPAGIAAKKAESRKSFVRVGIVIAIVVILVVVLLVTQQKTSRPEFDGIIVRPDTTFIPNKAITKPKERKHQDQSTPSKRVAESPMIHQTFVRFRFPSGQLLLLRLEDPSHFETKGLSVSIGDTVMFMRTRSNIFGDEWYEFYLPDNREGRNVGNGVIIAKFDSLVYH